MNRCGILVDDRETEDAVRLLATGSRTDSFAVFYMSKFALGFYATNVMCIWFALWGVSLVAERYRGWGAALSTPHRRNVITYALEIVITTALFLWTCVLIHTLYAEPTTSAMRASSFIGTFMSTMYLFEMTYRSDMRAPLIVHHLGTIAMFFLTISLFERGIGRGEMCDAHLLKTTTVLSLNALTEQPIFVALLWYRLWPAWHTRWLARLFFASAVQNALIKSITFVWGFVIWVREPVALGETTWVVLYPFLAVFGLFVPQLYACWVQYLLARKCASASRRHSEIKI